MTRPSARPAPRTTQRPTRWSRFLLLILALWLGAGLRFYRADHQEFWGDEGAKIEVVNQGVAHLFDPAAEVHPRFFHSLLFVWYRLFGLNLYGLRMLPALLGVLGLPLIGVLARRLFGRWRAGLAAVFLAAVSPFLVAYAQDITMYTLLFAMITLSFYLLARLWANPAGWRWWAAYVVATALMVHTHYYAVFALAAQNVFVLIWQRRLLPRWPAAQAAVAALTLPWLYLHYRLLAGQAVDQVQDFSLANLGRILQQGAVGFTVGSTFPAAYAWLGWVFVLVALGALAALWLRPSTRAVGALLGAWLLLPPLLVWVFDIWLQHFGERFISMSLPALLLLLAYAGQPRSGWLKPTAKPLAGAQPRSGWLKPTAKPLAGATLLAALAICAAVALRGWYFDPTFLKSTYGALMARIARDARPGDVLLLDNPQQAILFEMYQPDGLPYRFISPDSVLTPEAADRDFPGLVAGYDRAWLVLYGAPATYDPDHRAEAWLGTHGYKVFNESELGHLALYVLPGEHASETLQPSGAAFANGPRLAEFAFGPAQVRPGEPVLVTLRWQAPAVIEDDYSVFVHLWDAAGQLVAQSDGQPVSGTRPTSTWAPGEFVLDRRAVLVLAGTPPGDYSLQVGFYHPFTGERLLLADDAGLDHLFLGTIRVVP